LKDDLKKKRQKKYQLKEWELKYKEKINYRATTNFHFES
jgi:hypothetical protein